MEIDEYKMRYGPVKRGIPFTIMRFNIMVKAADWKMTLIPYNP